MAKTDWQYHIANYLEQYASTLTLAQYAEANGLNPNTVRREMKPAINVAQANQPAGKKPASKSKKPPKTPDEPAPVLKVGKVLRAEVRQMSADQRAARKRDQNSDQNSDQNGGDQNSDHNQADHNKGRGKREPAPGKASGGR